MTASSNQRIRLQLLEVISIIDPQEGANVLELTRLMPYAVNSQAVRMCANRLVTCGELEIVPDRVPMRYRRAEVNPLTASARSRLRSLPATRYGKVLERDAAVLQVIELAGEDGMPLKMIALTLGMSESLVKGSIFRLKRDEFIKPIRMYAPEVSYVAC